MPPKFKITGSSLMALSFLCIAFIANLVVAITNSLSSGIASVEAYRNQTLPLSILEFIKSGIILIMGYLLFRIIRNVMSRVKWNMGYYKMIKWIGWLNVLVLLIDAAVSTWQESVFSKQDSIMNHLADHNLYQNALLTALFNAPVSWFLTLCIFLIADILQYAAHVKMEQDTII
ncbi:DUF2975 domain-containing protein [Niabella drilacis]|uniref:DUF2975 domain-containing protein n=1 Tax=Niabella drilacis (strain DSM 25811 / CCM 8410 / CCUG 62505 / LMG 26954 / E90) TaxID=1285928 RepID=A0A1G6PF63_NIADE|nr:DUF2975 domain-containing protein [Niabella drilacis]SDC78773.1 Protein of unknown function [Niabella drilacis]